MTKFTERAAAQLEHQFPLEGVSAGTAPQLLMNHAFTRAIAGIETALDAATLRRFMAAETNLRHPLRLLAYLATCELIGSECDDLGRLARDVFPRAAEQQATQESRAMILESLAVLMHLDGDLSAATRFRRARLRLPLFASREEAAVEVVYLVGTEAAREYPDAIALSVARVGAEVVRGGPFVSVAPLVLAAKIHSLRAGIPLHEFLRGALERLDEARFAADSSERFSFAAREYRLLEGEPGIGADIDVGGVGALVAGAHGFDATTWRLYEWLGHARAAASAHGVAAAAPLRVDSYIHLGDSVEAGGDVRLFVQGRADTALEFVANAARIPVRRPAHVAFLRGGLQA